MTVMKIVPGVTRLGWIGTGVMGSSMCGHLIAKGFADDGLQPHAGEGQAAARQRRRVGRHAAGTWPQQSDVVFTIVGFPRDVREVMLGADGALAGCKSGNVLVDMTTSEPSLAVEIAEAAQAARACIASTRRSPAATSARAKPGSRS